MIVVIMRMAIAIVVFLLIHRIWFWFIHKMEAEDQRRQAEMTQKESAKDQPVKKLEMCRKCDAYVVEDEVHKCTPKEPSEKE